MGYLSIGTSPSECARNVYIRNMRFTYVFLTIILGISISTISIFSPVPSSAQENITLNALLVEPRDRWEDVLIPMALQNLTAKHPELDIQVNYTILPYNEARDQMLKAMENKSTIDLISVDQIWLGEFADRGYLTDLGNYSQAWGRLDDWYESNLDGAIYNDKIYGIWAWTDVRSIWYWKDLLNQSGVDPNSLRTWDGYISSAKNLNAALKEQGIQGVELIGGPGSQNEWYPFLWMLGGSIVESRPNHPTNEFYWFPSYNSTQGVRALEFFKRLVDAGIKPITIDFEKEFANKKYTAMLGGSWLPGSFESLTKQEFEQQIGMIPMFPVPVENATTSTIMGGWLLSIPENSKYKDLSWELIETMLEPQILSSMLAEYGYLPTQISIGEGPYSGELRKSIPYYDQLISLIEYGRARPNIAEYPQIADHIREAIDQVYNGTKEPEQALDDAAAKSAKTLGW
ncbi:MAG: extracellular solute-binding protein [Nitrososphaeraceae archaeon]|jgi:multiple sugar transport system substrate-binding protein